MKIENRSAKHNYKVLSTLECGISLKGYEVKSVAAGMCSIKEAWVDIRDPELILKGMHITAYSKDPFVLDEKRDRVLLAHKYEILRLKNIVSQKGYTLIPLEIYIQNGKYKVKVGVCKGLKDYDKRQMLKERDLQREIDNA